MPIIRIFDLHLVGDDEHQAMVAALEAAAVDFYETPRSQRDGSGGIFVQSEDEANRARAVITKAQQEWVESNKGEAKLQTAVNRKSPAAWFILGVITLVLLIFFLNPGSSRW